MQLKRWRENSDHLIVCMNADKDIYKKSIGKELASLDGLNMREVIPTFTRKRQLQHSVVDQI